MLVHIRVATQALLHSTSTRDSTFASSWPQDMQVFWHVCRARMRAPASVHLQVPERWTKYLLPKGFVAVDGCSLTVRHLYNHFDLCLNICTLARLIESSHRYMHFCTARRKRASIWQSPCQVGEVGPDCFSVYLIPETLRVTILDDRKVGDAINVEIDSQTQVCVFRLSKMPATVPAAPELPLEESCFGDHIHVCTG